MKFRLKGLTMPRFSLPYENIPELLMETGNYEDVEVRSLSDRVPPTSPHPCCGTYSVRSDFRRFVSRVVRSVRCTLLKVEAHTTVSCEYDRSRRYIDALCPTAAAMERKVCPRETSSPISLISTRNPNPIGQRFPHDIAGKFAAGLTQV